jgi:hypothetical protein
VTLSRRERGSALETTNGMQWGVTVVMRKRGECYLLEWYKSEMRKFREKESTQ